MIRPNMSQLFAHWSFVLLQESNKNWWGKNNKFLWIVFITIFTVFHQSCQQCWKTNCSTLHSVSFSPSFQKPHTVFMPVNVHCCVSLPITKLICFCGSAPSAAWCCAETWSPLGAGCVEAGGGGGRSQRTALGLMAHTVKSGNTRWRFRVTGWDDTLHEWVALKEM